MNEMLEYLSDLESNNNADWFHQNNARHKAATARFESLMGALMTRLEPQMPGLLRFSPKELSFKLQRDTRFSHDKSPYNPCFRCHLSPGGKAPVPVGFFVALRPGDRSILGAGLFADMFADATARIRKAVADDGQAFQAVLDGLKPHFAVEGTRLKRVPAGFPEDHPLAEYLKFKCWYIEHRFDDAKLDDETAFLDFAAEVHTAVKPFNDFLNTALEGFTMPARPQ